MSSWMEGWRRRPPLNSTLTRKLIELFQYAHFLSSLLLCYVYILHMHLLLQCSRFHAENSAHRPSTSSSLNTGTPITFRHINSHTFYPLFITVVGGRGILFSGTHADTHELGLFLALWFINPSALESTSFFHPHGQTE